VYTAKLVVPHFFIKLKQRLAVDKARVLAFLGRHRLRWIKGIMLRPNGAELVSDAAN
jgi:hypothetical protein